jgi:ribose transport system substrate-binding protein
VKNLEFLVSLTTDDNDYQQEQAAAAKAGAQRVGAQVSVISAGNDAITQSQQLLEAIQASPGRRPNAIIFEPVGSAMPQVARAAVAAGIGWVVLNRDVDYISDLRKDSQLPIFFLTSDHEEIGRIQGRQLQALLPNGGTVLYIQGPSGSSAAQQRAYTEGTMDGSQLTTGRGCMVAPAHSTGSPY